MSDEQQNCSVGESGTNRRDVLKAMGAGGASLSIAKQFESKRAQAETEYSGGKKVKLVEIQSVGRVESTDGQPIKAKEMNTDTFIEYSIQDDTLIVPTNEVASGLEFGEYVVNSLDSYTNRSAESMNQFRLSRIPRELLLN